MNYFVQFSLYLLGISKRTLSEIYNNLMNTKQVLSTSLGSDYGLLKLSALQCSSVLIVACSKSCVLISYSKVARTQQCFGFHWQSYKASVRVDPFAPTRLNKGRSRRPGKTKDSLRNQGNVANNSLSQGSIDIKL